MNQIPPNESLTGKQLKTLGDICVYGWRRGESYLYVGASGKALGRIGTHNTIGKVEPILDDDRIDFWKFDNWEDAEMFEITMNKAFRPKYSAPVPTGMNAELECPRCKRKFSATRAWQRWCSPECRQGRNRPGYGIRPD